MNINSKCWFWPKILKFDCILTTINFWLNIVGFQSSEQLTKQTCNVRHENWHENSWGHIRDHVNHLRPLKPNHPWEIQNPSCGPIA